MDETTARMLRDAWARTKPFVRWDTSTIYYIVAFIIGCVAFALFKGWGAVMDQISVALAFGVVSTLVIGSAVFVFHLVLSPGRLLLEEFGELRQSIEEIIPESTGSDSGGKEGHTVDLVTLTRENYEHWDKVDPLHLWQAACLWADLHVSLDVRKFASPGYVRFSMLLRAVEKGDIEGEGSSRDAKFLQFTREELKRYAESIDEKPPFLFPEHRNNRL